MYFVLFLYVYLAQNVSKKMKAKFTMLTHFSARYGKVPVFSDCDYKENKIGFAYDFMYLNPHNLTRSLAIVEKLNVCYKISNLDNEQRKSNKEAKRFRASY